MDAAKITDLSDFELEGRGERWLQSVARLCLGIAVAAPLGALALKVGYEDFLMPRARLVASVSRSSGGALDPIVTGSLPSRPPSGATPRIALAEGLGLAGADAPPAVPSASVVKPAQPLPPRPGDDPAKPPEVSAVSRPSFDPASWQLRLSVSADGE